MLLLDHHPRPVGTDGSAVTVPGLSPDCVATTAHLLHDVLIFVAVDGDVFRVGVTDGRGSAQVLPEPARTPVLSVAERGFAYVTNARDVVCFDIERGETARIAGQIDSVTVSSDLRWAAIRQGPRSRIRDLTDPSRELAARAIDDTVLALDGDGRATLTKEAAAAAVQRECRDDWPFAWCGAMTVRSTTYAFFDSLTGTAVVCGSSVWGGEHRVVWLRGLWVVGPTVENDAHWLVLRRLDEYVRYRLPADPGQLETPPPDRARFSIENVVSADGTEVPITRFRRTTDAAPHSLVTVHGGFGITLRPFIGLSAESTTVSDFVYAHVRGGGERGPSWAVAGQGAGKHRGLADVGAVVAAERRQGEISLLGTSHGGWLALLAALTWPDHVDRVCVTAPITHLAQYLRSPLGRKHRREFPEDEVDRFDPSVLIEAFEGRRPPDLMLVYGQADTIVTGQRAEEFARAWRGAGGICWLVRHTGGHYAPPATDVTRVLTQQMRFLNTGPRAATVDDGAPRG